MVKFDVELTKSEAEAFSQFLKRAGFSEYRQCAIDDDEAYLMRDAADRIRDALAEMGFAPR